jgi:hypothetical protein
VRARARRILLGRPIRYSDAGVWLAGQGVAHRAPALLSSFKYGPGQPALPSIYPSSPASTSFPTTPERSACGARQHGDCEREQQGVVRGAQGGGQVHQALHRRQVRRRRLRYVHERFRTRPVPSPSSDRWSFLLLALAS